MKRWNQLCLAGSAIVMLCGCGMMNDNNKTNGTANASNTNPPQTSRSNDMGDKVKQGVDNVEDSIDNMMSYLTGKGLQMDDVTPIEQMDFAAHEGRSFTINGSTGYLYRLKSDDENMKKLLQSAKEKGTVKVNINGEEQEYNASVNGDYLFVYKKDADMNQFNSLMKDYIPGAYNLDGTSGNDFSSEPSQRGNTLENEQD